MPAGRPSPHPLAYIFSGADKTRSFMEWRLLDKLASNSMRVPRPAAARYVQRGTFYTADIITVRVPDIVPLSQYIADHAPGAQHLRDGQYQVGGSNTFGQFSV